MTAILFLAGFLVLPLIGSFIWCVDFVRRLDLGGRLAVAGATGAVVVAVTMALLSLVGIGWSRAILVPLFAVIAVLGRPSSALRAPSPAAAGEGGLAATLAIGVFVALTTYGALTARESAGDLQFFWGPKGVRFYHAGGIDPVFLKSDANANKDYPPMLPLLFAWAQTLSRQFSWWSALLVSVLCLAGSAAMLRASSGDDHAAVLLAGMLAWGFASSYAAGGTDPPLLFFEIVALCAVTFGDANDGRRGADLVAAIALAGAAWTKIEGATFAIAVVLALLLTRQFRRALVGVPAAVLVAAWMIFAARHDITFAYGGAKMKIYFEVIPQTIFLTLKHASYGLFWLPWIAVLLLIALGPARRDALLPAIVAVLSFGAMIFFYVHVPTPEWWILHSSTRVQLTPLAALTIGAAAAWRRTSDLR